MKFLLVLLFFTGCNQQYSTSIQGHPECKMVVGPSYMYQNSDPLATAEYGGEGKWTKNNQVIGWSAYEDSTVWNRKSCTR